MSNDDKGADESDWQIFRAVHERMRADDEEVFRQNMFKVKLHDGDHIIIFAFCFWKGYKNMYIQDSSNLLNCHIEAERFLLPWDVYRISKSALNIFNNMNYQWDWEVLIWFLVIELNSYPNI